MKKNNALKFVGKGDAYLPGIPAADLTEEQVETFVVWGLTTGSRALVATGLYEAADETPEKPEKAAKAEKPDTHEKPDKDASARTHVRSKGKE